MPEADRQRPGKTVPPCRPVPYRTRLCDLSLFFPAQETPPYYCSLSLCFSHLPSLSCFVYVLSLCQFFLQTSCKAIVFHTLHAHTFQHCMTFLKSAIFLISFCNIDHTAIHCIDSQQNPGLCFCKGIIPGIIASIFACLCILCISCVIAIKQPYRRHQPF